MLSLAIVGYVLLVIVFWGGAYMFITAVERRDKVRFFIGSFLCVIVLVTLGNIQL